MAFRVSSALGWMKISVMCMGMIHGSNIKFVRKKKPYGKYTDIN